MADTRNSAPSGASNTAPPTNAIPGSHPDAAILRAFETYRQGREAIWQSATDAETKPFWDRVDAADAEVMGLPANTPAGIATKLWLALIHSTEDCDTDRAAVRTDLGWFDARGEELDWNLRHFISALRAIEFLSTIEADDPVSRYWTAFNAHNADQLSADDYFVAFYEMWNWTPPTPRDFIRKFEAAYSIGGCPTEENQEKLVEQAVAIIGQRAGVQA